MKINKYKHIDITYCGVFNLSSLFKEGCDGSTNRDSENKTREKCGLFELLDDVHESMVSRRFLDKINNSNQSNCNSLQLSLTLDQPTIPMNEERELQFDVGAIQFDGGAFDEAIEIQVL